jgi:hypothetical protein
MGLGHKQADTAAPTRARAGLKILVPGYPQWSWHQRGRAFVLLGSFAVSLAVGLFSWGTPLGAALLAFAYCTHVASATDVVRQQAFPGFGRWVPLISTGGGLGLGLYGPALALLCVFAWPGTDDGLAPQGYLVNCRAYAASAPQHPDWVWLRTSPWGQSRLARVVAGPGQEVEWADGRFRVDGRPIPVPLSWTARPLPDNVRFTIPPEHLLVAPGSAGSGQTARGGPMLIARGEINGRAWARYYPIRQRTLLSERRKSD